MREQKESDEFVADWIKKLEKEGFSDLRVCPIPPNEDLPEHTHDEHTVHVILNGDLIITDRNGTKTYHSGAQGEL
ncbi:MAG: hypothetical protein Q7S15_00100 [bacterium]|nr:hypothetical protein [bacterium]